MAEREIKPKAKRCTKNCVAFGCNNVASLDSRTAGITFHCFPFSKPEVAKKWERAMHRKDFTATKHSRVCSVHFTPESFDRTGCIVRIRAGAVPTIFNLPGHRKHKKSSTENCQRNLNVAHTAITSSSTVHTANAVTPVVEAATRFASPIISANTSLSTVETNITFASPVEAAAALASPVKAANSGLSAVKAANTGLSAVKAANTGLSAVKAANSGLSAVKAANTGLSPVKAANTGLSPVKAASSGLSAVVRSSVPVVKGLPVQNHSSSVMESSALSQVIGTSFLPLSTILVLQSPNLPARVEHSYSLPSSTELKHQLDLALSTLAGYKMRLRSAQQKTRRLELRLESLRQLIASLIENEIISQEAANCIRSKFHFSFD